MIWKILYFLEAKNSLQLLAAYTLGKVVDDAPNVYAGGPGGDASLLSDAMNPHADWGPSVNDQRHRLSFSGVWDLAFADRFSGPSHAVLRDWQLSFILAAQSGQPYSGMVSFDLNNDGNAGNDRTPGSPRNTFYAPATVSLDPRLTRMVPVGGRATLQLACEAFNVFNRSNIIAVRTFTVTTASLKWSNHLQHLDSERALMCVKRGGV